MREYKVMVYQFGTRWYRWTWYWQTTVKLVRCDDQVSNGVTLTRRGAKRKAERAASRHQRKEAAERAKHKRASETQETYTPKLRP